MNTLVDWQWIKFYLQSTNFDKYKSKGNKNVEEKDNYIYDESTNKLYHGEIIYTKYPEYLKSVGTRLKLYYFIR